MRLYARRVCHGSYVWNDTIKEEEKEEEEPRILILRRVQQRRGRATYLNLTTCAEKRKKCHVSQNDV